MEALGNIKGGTPQMRWVNDLERHVGSKWVNITQEREAWEA